MDQSPRVTPIPILGQQRCLVCSDARSFTTQPIGRALCQGGAGACGFAFWWNQAKTLGYCSLCMAISCLILLQDSRDFGIPPKNDLITATLGYGLKDDEICVGNFHKSTRLMKIMDLEFASWITKAQDEIMNFTEFLRWTSTFSSEETSHSIFTDLIATLPEETFVWKL